jgi:hypothetical protein
VLRIVVAEIEARQAKAAEPRGSNPMQVFPSKIITELGAPVYDSIPENIYI